MTLSTVTTIPEISDYYLRISSIWSSAFKSFEAREYVDLRTHPRSPGFLRDGDLLLPLCVSPSLFPTEDTKYSPFLRMEVKQIINYIQNLVMLGYVIAVFYYNSERVGCPQKIFSCQHFQNKLRRYPKGIQIQFLVNASVQGLTIKSENSS